MGLKEKFDLAEKEIQSLVNGKTFLNTSSKKEDKEEKEKKDEGVQAKSQD